MNNAKEIAENIVESHYKPGPNFTLELEDAEKLARAYLELNEKYDKVLSYTSASLDIDTAFTIVSMNDEITKLKKSRGVLRKAVEYYDQVHRQHWAINFNDLPEVAIKAIRADNEIFADRV